MFFSSRKERRAPRDDASAVDVMKLTAFNKLTIMFANRPRINLAVSLVVVLLEFAAVAFFFTSFEQLGVHLDTMEVPTASPTPSPANSTATPAPPVKPLRAMDISVFRTPILTEYSYVQGALGAYYLAQWFFHIWAEEGDRISEIFSIRGLISAITSITMFAALFYAESEEWSGVVLAVFAPSFLRVWWAHWYLHTFIAHYFTFHAAIKEIISQAVFVTAVTVSSVGFYQFSHLVGRYEVISFERTLYFVVVTVTTMGYGDISPVKGGEFREGMIVVTVVIFVAMFFLPTLLSKFGEMTAYLESQNFYTSNVLHVIVYGELPYSDMRLMLREFMSGSRKFDPLHLVMVSPVEFEPEVRDLANQTEYQDRITLCVGDPMDRSQIPRFGARRADVVFAISPRSSTAQRGDLQTILRSIAFRRHDANLPQYLMLKRGSHSTAVKRWAFTLIEREALKFRLLGLSLKLPGFVPFFLNLIKTTEQHSFSPEEQRKSWWKQYLCGMSNSIFTMPLPEVLEGRKFSSVCLIILVRTGMIPIALVRKDGKKVHLCPMDDVLRDRDRIILLATSNRVVERCYMHFGIIDSAKITSGGSKKPDKKNQDAVAAAEAAEIEMSNTTFGAIQTTKITKRPKKRRTNIFPFRDHIVLIDISPSLESPDLNLEEKVDAARFQAHDMMNLLLPFSRAANTTIVYLSRWDLSEEFYDAWPKHARPIYHVMGSGTDNEDVTNCNVASARGVVIFTSLEGSSSVGDAHVVMVQDLVYRHLQAAGREKDVPIVVEVDDVSSLYMLNPKVAKTQSDTQFEESFKNYFLTPVFSFGGAVSSAMLDTVVYQTYFNEFLPQVIDLLLFCNKGTKEVVFAESVTNFFPPVQKQYMQRFTFADLFRFATGRGCVPFGLHRVVNTTERGENLLGYRYFVTAPHPSLPLRDDDVVYYISTTKGDK